MDRALIEAKLESLRRCLRRIEAKCPATAEELSRDVDAQDILTLNLTRAVQLSVDIAAHWIASLDDVEAPDTMGGMFEALARCGRLDGALAERMRKAVGFRNIAVHQYEDVDWHILHAICASCMDGFTQFARTVWDAVRKGEGHGHEAGGDG